MIIIYIAECNDCHWRYSTGEKSIAKKKKYEHNNEKEHETSIRTEEIEFNYD